MTTSRQQWDLFGIDLRRWWLSFCGAWREVFWDHGSSVRTWIDEPVQLFGAGQALNLDANNATTNTARAELLPDAMVLVRRLPLPKGVALDLSSVVEGEVQASSPFQSNDTAFGWRVLNHGGGLSEVLLAIVSKSAVMGHLHIVDSDLTANSVEVWAEDNGCYVVINGFAEQQRDIRYRKRLWHLASMGVVISLALVLAVSVPMFFKTAQLANLENSLAGVRDQVQESVALRASLASLNQKITQLNVFTKTAARPLYPLNTLTQQLSDNAWLLSYQQKGRSVTIEGVANNAAALLQQLSESGRYEDVKPVSAIRTVSRGKQERFKVELTLSPESVRQL